MANTYSQKYKEPRCGLRKYIQDGASCNFNDDVFKGNGYGLHSEKCHLHYTLYSGTINIT